MLRRTNLLYGLCAGICIPNRFLIAPYIPNLRDLLIWSLTDCTNYKYTRTYKFRDNPRRSR